MRKFLVGLLCLMWCGLVNAAQDYEFTLMSRSDIDQEIVVARILPFYQYMGGHIELRWSNGDMDAIAEQVMHKMIKEGIRRQDITRNKSPDSRSLGLSREQLRVVLKTTKTTMTCQPYRLGSAFPEPSQRSCALDDNLAVSRMRSE